MILTRIDKKFREADIYWKRFLTENSCLRLPDNGEIESNSKVPSCKTKSSELKKATSLCRADGNCRVCTPMGFTIKPNKNSIDPEAIEKEVQLQ